MEKQRIMHSARITAAGILALLILGCRSAESDDRVAVARAETDRKLAELFRAKGLLYPPRELFLRAFKDEGELEVWARDTDAARFALVKTYTVCRQSGALGPKRREGDGQVPEGFYFVDRFNARSKFYLSLGLNYPNAADRILGDPERPGSDIFIHGDCVSVGCLAMTDASMKEIYWLAVQARDGGQEKIEAHFFPYRFGRPEGPPRGDFARFQGLWSSLEAGYDFFEKRRILPSYTVNPAGDYLMHETPSF